MRYTIETAKAIFSEYDCELLEENYVNSSTPMFYRCQCGEMSSIALSDFKRGRRCLSCGNKKAGKTRQEKAIDIEDLRYFFEKEGCELTSEYSSYNDPLEYICSCGEIGRTTWFSFQLGRRCGRCSPHRKKQYSVDEVRQIFAEQDCELLQDHYESSLVAIKYRCSCGKTSKITLNNFMKGSRCKQCGLQKMTGPNNPRWIKDRKKKRENDLFRKKCGFIVRRCLTALNEAKNDRTHKLLGYTPKQLQEHIKNHPNWDKVKNGRWHLDHIFPIAAFFEHGITDLKVINHLDNLQPLSQEENNKKSAKYNKKEFRAWLKEHGLD